MYASDSATVISLEPSAGSDSPSSVTSSDLGTSSVKTGSVRIG